MVSILLGSLLSLAISKVYLESIRNYIAEEELARIQDNGRFSLSLLSRELRSAGFYAAKPVDDELPSAPISGDCVGSGNWALDVSEPIDFINDFDSRSAESMLTLKGYQLTCLAGAEIAPGTDILSVKRTAGSYTVKNGAYQGRSVARTNQWYLKVEGYGTDRQWFYHRSGGFPSPDIGPGTGMDYWEYYARIFYIRKFSEAVTDGIPTLCVEKLTGGSTLGIMSTRCLVEGVEDMQIEFGLDGDFDGAPDKYTEEPQGSDLGSAIVARIYLLMRSVGEIPEYRRHRTYHLGSKRIERQDGYVRRVMSVTVKMSNISMAVG